MPIGGCSGVDEFYECRGHHPTLYLIYICIVNRRLNEDELRESILLVFANKQVGST